jgi:TIR domain
VAHDVFISYSSKDKPVADAVCARLEAASVRCWIAPRDVVPGMDWSEAIIDAINGSRAVVLVYSSNANESPQIRREVERAVAKRIAIIPFRIEDVPMSKSLEYFISTPHWLDALTPPLERHLDYLAETLRRLTRPTEEPLPSPRAEPALPPSSAPPAAVTAHHKRAFPLNRLALIGGVVIVGLIALALYRYTAASPSSSFDSRLAGTWTAPATVNNLPILLTMTVGRDGRGSLVSTLRDHGRYDSGRGRWTMTNAAGQTMRGTYSFTSDRTMSMTGPLGTAPWTRDATSPADPSGKLSGTWVTTGTAPDGLPAKTSLVFAPDGTYQFAASSEDVLIVQARDGRWRAASSTTGRTTEGTYTLQTPDSLMWIGATGTTVWTRGH